MIRFPRGLAHLVPDTLTGTVAGLVVRPRRRAPVREVASWTVDSDADHGRSKKRAVTLIASEDIAAIAATLGTEVDWRVLRRNVLLTGINPRVLRGRRFRLGDAVLEGTKPCDPCSRMPQILADDRAYAAMMGRGGVCAAIVEPGVVRLGDRVELLPL